MPKAAPRPCTYPGCTALCAGGRCDRHRVQDRKEQHQRCDARRGSASERGYDNRWQKARAGYLRSHPLCRRCEQRGDLTPATVVDHIVPHRGDRDLFWRSDNWQPLCKPCHDRKTATEDGGGWQWHRGASNP
jgi:5-methylcytosine-specific restriction enzyme A